MDRQCFDIGDSYTTLIRVEFVAWQCVDTNICCHQYHDG